MNKICIVTGSSGGIGAKIAAKFAAESAAGVVLHGRQLDNLNKVKSAIVSAGYPEGNVLITIGEITDEQVLEKCVEDTVKKFGRIDVLVNNAGAMKLGNVADTDLKVLDEMYQINVRSTVSLTQKCLPHLIKSKGCIVNISTGLALKAQPISTYYSMCKAAIDHFTRCLATEVGSLGVRVNSVNPGYIPGTSLLTRKTADSAPMQSDDHYLASYPMKRFAIVDEVVDAVVWLAGHASGTTGICLSVDCGLHIG